MFLKSGNVAGSFPSVPALSQLPRTAAQKMLVFLYHFYALKLSRTQEALFENFTTIIGEFVADKYPVGDFLD